MLRKNLTLVFVLSASLAGVIAAQSSAGYVVDPSVVPFQDSLPDAGYGVRPLAAAQDSVNLMTYVANEVLFTPNGPNDLAAFLQRYGGAVVNDGSIPAPPPQLADRAALRTSLAPRAATYTIRLDPSNYNPQSIVADAHSQGVPIETVRFSSDNAARLLALVLHEQGNGLPVTLNFVSQPNDYLAKVPKSAFKGQTDAMQWQVFHDNSFGNGNPYQQCIDANFTWYCNQSSSGSSVYMAWRFVADYAPSYRPKVAIIDGGFWLDANGNSLADPNGGNPLPPHPAQYNFLNNSYNASGTNANNCSGGNPCPYHGAGTSNVALASLGYPFDGAGTAGQIGDAILLYSDLSTDHMALAVRTAVAWGADIISISSSRDCQWGVGLCGEGSYAGAIDDAHAAGVLVVAAAGNNGQDATNSFPCNYGPVLCVGALGDGQSRPRVANDWSSNFGDRVHLWAPTNIPAIYPNPDGTYNFRTFGGTSASTPFVAGVAAMVKAVNPGLSGDDVAGVLITTAYGQDFLNEVLDNRPDAGGSVGRLIFRLNAYLAVLQAAGGYHLKPDIRITSPQDGAVVQVNGGNTCGAQFSAAAADVQDGQWPLQSYGSPNPTPIVFTSDLPPYTQGYAGNCGLSFSPGEGFQHITATVTNSNGISNSATIGVTVKYPHVTPTPVISWPPANTTVPAGTYTVTGYAKSTDPGVLGNFDCNRLVWNNSVPAVPVPNSNGMCQAQLTFNGPTEVVTLSAADIFGDKGSTSVTVKISGQDQAQLAVQILNPQDGSSVRISNSSSPLGLQAGADLPQQPNTAVYTWYWYFTAKGAGTKQQITATGSPAATWNAQASGLCKVSTPQNITLEVDVVDFTLLPPMKTYTGSTTANITLTCQSVF